MGALRSETVGLGRLARRVEAAHFPYLTATRDVVPDTTGKSLSVPQLLSLSPFLCIVPQPIPFPPHQTDQPYSKSDL